MVETKANLNLHDWLERISKAGSRKEIYKILEEFRPLTWTDNERSTMARHYMKVIDNMPQEEEDDTTGDDTQAKQGDDGPVWYEKM